MAQVKKGMDRPQKMRSATVGGISFAVNLFAKVVDTPITQTDFVPEKVSVKAVLQREGKPDIVMINTNLLVLAMFSTIHKNRNKWLYGSDLLNASPMQKASKMRFFEYEFATPIKLADNDLLTVTVTVPDIGAYTANIDDDTSYVEFKEINAIGYEAGVTVLETQVIEGASTNDTVNLGEDVLDVVMLNFDRNSLETPVLNNVTLSSQFYNRNFSYRDLIINDNSLLPDNIDERLGSTIPMAAGNPAGMVFPWLTPFPQCFFIHKSRKHAPLVHAKLELSFNAENVVTSKNYAVYTKMMSDGTTIRKAHAMQEKHAGEQLDRLDKKG